MWFIIAWEHPVVERSQEYINWTPTPVELWCIIAWEYTHITLVLTGYTLISKTIPTSIYANELFKLLLTAWHGSFYVKLSDNVKKTMIALDGDFE